MSFDLDFDLRDLIVAQANDSDLSTSEWLRNAAKEKLGINETPRAMAEAPAVQAPRDKSYEIGEHNKSCDYFTPGGVCDCGVDPYHGFAIKPVQTSDTPNAEWWNAKLKDIAAMRPVDGRMALRHATKGIAIPSYLFVDRKGLAQWLSEHVK